MDNFEPNNPQQPSPASGMAPRMPRVTSGLLVAVIIISLVCGAVGGMIGTIVALRNPRLVGQSNSINPSSSQTVNLTENSDIVNVVKKASPAVVSIIISQNLSMVPGFGSSSDNSDPFFNFFYNNGQSQQQPDSGSGSGSSDLQQVGAGSGFFVSSDGLIVTNKHVVSDSNASYTVITSDGKQYTAQVVAQDPVNDLALVKIKISNAPYLQLASSSGLQVGQQVIAIGNSLGQYQNTVTSGIISGIGRQITAGGEDGSEQLNGVIQTDAAINPGNSGGPLLNSLGQVVGINTAIDQQGQLVGFAIPSNEISTDISSYQSSGKITHAFLGVRYEMLTPDLVQQDNLPVQNGAIIVRGQTDTDFAVQPGSPADKAGLMENDIITAVNGTAVTVNDPLSEIMENYKPGDKVQLQVYHRGKQESVSVTLGST